MVRVEAKTQAFSLVEIALALAIASVALVSILGLIPTVLNNHRAGADQRALGTIYEDLHDRIEGADLVDGLIPSSPYFYTANGDFIPPDSSALKPNRENSIGGAFFRAEAAIVSVTGSPGIRAVAISIFWPLSGEHLPITPDAPGSRHTYVITPLTGKGWEEVDGGFQPGIEY